MLDRGSGTDTGMKRSVDSKAGVRKSSQNQPSRGTEHVQQR